MITLGKKLQRLRKEKGMSQEQLASQLTVSRQAVSKWELDSSLPDTENVILLSKLFGVSTDYLLKDEAATDINYTKNNMVEEAQIKSSLIIGVGIIAIGLLASFIGWRTYQTDLAIGIGMGIQIVGIIAFELMQSRCTASDKSKAKRRFYATASWLICPYIALHLSRMALFIYPRPYSYLTALTVPAIIYFVICTVITIILRFKTKA